MWFKRDEHPIPIDDVQTSVIEIGWVLQTSQASFIWDAPRPFRRPDIHTSSSKAVTRCPAVIDLERGLIEVLCPFNLRLAVEAQEDGTLRVIKRPDEASISDSVVSQVLVVSPADQWRHPKRPIIQIVTPYTFVADQIAYLCQLPPFLEYRSLLWPGVFIGGRVPIHIWPRKLNWAFEWYDLQKELVFFRGQPWFYCRFETVNPAQSLRIVEAALTPQLRNYLSGIEGVVNYVSHTFSLFQNAKERRPSQLLVKVKR